jgi:ribosomal protein L6P/L9E
MLNLSDKKITSPYVKSFLIKGMGYNVELVENIGGSKQEFPYLRYISMRLGHSYNIYKPIPDQIGVIVGNKGRKLVIFGFDKNKVSTFANQIYKNRVPGIYTGDGVRIKGFSHIRKIGKKDGKKGKV